MPAAVRVLIPVLLILGLAAPADAHDIPNDVRVQMFFRLQPTSARLLVRVPLAAMRDIDFPQRGPGFLDLSRVDASLQDAATLWISDNIRIFENDRLLAAPRVAAARVSLPSDPSFRSYESAVESISGPPLPANTEMYWDQGMLDVRFEYPIESAGSQFSMEPRLARLGLQVLTVLRFQVPGGDERGFEFHGNPGLVRLDPSWTQAASRFVISGFNHILDGVDHLLFLLCLVVPVRKFGQLAWIVTAFTLAHSITLIASAFGMAPSGLWFPPLVEAGIALSILFMAVENAFTPNLERRWLVAFAFGLVHGFGFSFALQETLQFAGSHLLVSLLSFNVGVELGQLLVLAAVIPLLGLIFRFGVAERAGTLVISVLVAHTAWHWVIERWDAFRQFELVWPEINVALLASLMRWLMVIVAVSAVAWLLGLVRGRLRGDVSA